MEEKDDSSGSDMEGAPPPHWAKHSRVSILAFPTTKNVTIDVPDYQGVDFDVSVFPSS